ncbi:1-acyl-sn-glycerol-3-phosphate acyltransferase [Isoptericola variabilis]|uniref:Phospholipid/glycerol acyltransferase n=1 Tax=Isoptericola variabilis (strain 225) TaxID=743718 RepID=F6FQ28_ISOV2|nr:lysophospholipid acyltransferase family protein [Isoptericola variabilis]AEG44834.1 phospholipid/glycerol acyltransferase [Isoptericola variabilis 225]TWH31644.1 1-acyl-sn-glycerol-3-phosphate acyltransferase [Isoptericola variabilis J7]
MPIARPTSRAYRAIAWLVRRLMFALVRYEWRGAEYLPRQGGFIAAANHATELDALTFAHFLFDHGYEPRIMAKRSLFTTPVLGSILRATRMIPVDRGSAAAARSLEAAAEQLGDGACVAIFPEGTITRDPDLWPMEPKTGLARIALATRLPVVPIAQWGAHEILPRYGRLPRPFPRKRVQMVAGPPVDLSDLYDKPLDAVVLREVMNRVMDAITALLSEVRGEPAPAARFDLRKHPEYEARRTHYPPVERP